MNNLPEHFTIKFTDKQIHVTHLPDHRYYEWKIDIRDLNENKISGDIYSDELLHTELEKWLNAGGEMINE